MKNRVCIPKDLMPHVIAEAENLLLTDDLTKCVEWILRDYFRSKSNSQAESSTQQATTRQEVQQSIIDDLNDVFAA
jgi:DNA-binding transcriptional regulator/RsmH inhibitor MraZ